MRTPEPARTAIAADSGRALVPMFAPMEMPAELESVLDAST